MPTTKDVENYLAIQQEVESNIIKDLKHKTNFEPHEVVKMFEVIRIRSFKAYCKKYVERKK